MGADCPTQHSVLFNLEMSVSGTCQSPNPTEERRTIQQACKASKKMMLQRMPSGTKVSVSRLRKLELSIVNLGGIGSKGQFGKSPPGYLRQPAHSLSPFSLISCNPHISGSRPTFSEITLSQTDVAPWCFKWDGIGLDLRVG